MRKLLAAITLSALMLLVSCGMPDSSMMLYSDGGCTIYRSRGKNTVMIRVSYSDLQYVEGLSGMDGKSALASLFDIPESSVTEIGWDEYFDRRNMLVLLAKETHSSSPEMALWKNAEDLENTAFLDTINTLSSSFDESLVKAIAESRGGYREYRLGDIITPAGSWERAEDFIRIWMDAALEIDYEG